MRKFKLKEDIVGLKAGHIFEFITDNSVIERYYKGTMTSFTTSSEILEEVKDEPLFYTNEDEVYIDGKKTAIRNKYSYFLIIQNTEKIESCVANKNISSFSNLDKRFTTKQAAEDYIKLQKAIKDSGLKVGDTITEWPKGIYYLANIWNKFQKNPSGNSKENGDTEIINGFVLYNNEPMIVGTYGVHYWLSDFSKPKLLFGDKEVEILTCSVQSGKQLSEPEIWLQGDASCTYSKAKKLREAINTIQSFRFGVHKIDTTYFNKVFTIGCQTGTIEQIDTILSECEKLMK